MCVRVWGGGGGQRGLAQDCHNFHHSACPQAQCVSRTPLRAVQSARDAGAQVVPFRSCTGSACRRCTVPGSATEAVSSTWLQRWCQGSIQAGGGVLRCRLRCRSVHGRCCCEGHRRTCKGSLRPSPFSNERPAFDTCGCSALCDNPAPYSCCAECAKVAVFFGGAPVQGA